MKRKSCVYGGEISKVEIEPQNGFFQWYCPKCEAGMYFSRIGLPPQTMKNILKLSVYCD